MINKLPDTPTNRLCTSLFSPARLSFLLQYSLAFVNESDGQHKHVMRYPQLFATRAIEKKLNSGIRKGIIWHTQGSGKTALAYYNVHFLTDYFQRSGIIPKFYFIVVVNIQKFEDDPDVVRAEDYDVTIQRVYFLDEVHRSYNPTGSFLANLSQSDQNAIKIGLTGTPLLGDDCNSRALFGDYIHKYY